MATLSTTIEHKPGKVESVVLTDEYDNLVEGRTYKYYASYLKKIESHAPAERERLSRIVSLCFEHEKQMLELVTRKGLPGVRLVREHPGLILEIEYVAGKTLADYLVSGVTHLESRMLFVSTVRCIENHNNEAIVLNDTHLTNFLVSTQGTVLFCDYGNASSAEHPFLSPPLASGNRKNETYFSEEQDKAFKADHQMDLSQSSAPYPPEKLKSNGLDCKGDFYVLAKHLLDLDAGLFDKELRKILEKMKLGKYQSADMILKDLAATAPKGVVTPEIEPVEQPVGNNAQSRRRKEWEWKRSHIMPRLAMTAAAGFCLVFGLKATDIYTGFGRTTINEIKALAVPSQQLSVGRSPEAPAKNADKAMTVAQTDVLPQKSQRQDMPMRQTVVVDMKANILPATEQKIKKQPQAAASVNGALKDVRPTDGHILAKARLDAVSSDTAVALRGIDALQQLVKLKSPVANQALEVLGKQIEKLENSVPSEPERQRLELLARHGHSRAHYLLARWLEEGKGMHGGRDLPEAYRHYVKASRKIDKAAEAATRLEKTAQLIVRNPPERAELFRLLLAIAERPENSQAQAAIGLIYAEGRYGQSINKGLAAKYLRKSVNNGFADAKDVMRKHGIKS